MPSYDSTIKENVLERMQSHKGTNVMSGGSWNYCL